MDVDALERDEVLDKAGKTEESAEEEEDESAEDEEIERA